MNMTIKKTLLAAAMLPLAIQPAQACWNAKSVQAAKIMHLNNMLMVSALRCRKGDHNFLADYNRFMKVNKPLLSQQVANTKQHFARAHGSRGAVAALDKFNIAIANRYGAGHPRMSCAQLKKMAQTLSSKQNLVSLTGHADRAVGVPYLKGGQCKSRIAAAK